MQLAVKPLVMWEINVISALALEAYIFQSQSEAIVNRERWIEAAETLRQSRAVEDEIFRRSLYAEAERLSIPVPLPPSRGRRFSRAGYEIASPEYAARWQAIRGLVKRLDVTHPFRKTFRLLTVEPMLAARDTGEEWKPSAEECYELLHLLEKAKAEMVVEQDLDRPTEAPEESLAAVLARTKEERMNQTVEAPTEAPEAQASRPKCEARRQAIDADELVRCGMPGREVVTYLGQPRTLCTPHAKQYAGWGERDRERMAQALWGWPTAGQLGEERAPTLGGMPEARPRVRRFGS